jgi:hypothetical protein
MSESSAKTCKHGVALSGICCNCDTQPHVIDMVNRPPHYVTGSMEAIDVMEAFELNLHLGNALKYILRAGKKGDAKEDIAKAVWWLKRELKRRG